MAAVVETRFGRVAGSEEEGLQVFRGIPFARPPLGELRFRAPQPPEPWAGVRDARRFAPAALQRKLPPPFGEWLDPGPTDEDCLYLNVYTPAPDGGRRPLLVWIHGGAFSLGSGSQAIYDGRALARRGDAVVVSINYRLGAFGFLRLDGVCPGLGATGNAGLLDQIAALEWVREHASAFGGDPGNVTIFGESAGGMSVGTLLGTPRAHGLFQRAIAQSGAAHNVHSREVADEVARALLDALGLAPREAPRLRELPADALLRAQERAALRVAGRRALLAFQPVVDGELLPEPPLDAIRGGLSREVALLAGTTRDEWNLFGAMDPTLRQVDEAGLHKRLGHWLGGDAAPVVAAYRAARAGRPSAPRDLLFAIETDRVFRTPAIRLAEAQRRHQPRTYMYLFTWEVPLLGAFHGIDIPFVFGLLDGEGPARLIGAQPQARALAERVQDAWLAFARRGEPGHPDPSAWPAYRGECRATMLLGPGCRVEDSPFDAERRAWDGVL